MLWSERWAEVRKRVSFLLGQAFRSVIGSPFGPIISILGPAHELRVVCLGQAFDGKQVHEGPRVYEPDTTTSTLHYICDVMLSGESFVSG